MTKALRKAIMHRSKLKNISHKTRAKEDWNNYKKQRNFCVNLLRNTKNDYFLKLNIKDLTDNKIFWKTIKPFLSSKGLNSNKLMLREKDVVSSIIIDVIRPVLNFFFYDKCYKHKKT